MEEIILKKSDLNNFQNELLKYVPLLRLKLAKFITKDYNYNLNKIDSLIFNSQSTFLVSYNEFIVTSHGKEFLQKYFNLKETTFRLKRLCEFYTTYSKNYPNYVVFPESKYFYKNLKRKQKLINNKVEEEEEEEFLENNKRKSFDPYFHSRTICDLNEETQRNEISVQNNSFENIINLIDSAENNFIKLKKQKIMLKISTRNSTTSKNTSQSRINTLKTYENPKNLKAFTERNSNKNKTNVPKNKTNDERSKNYQSLKNQKKIETNKNGKVGFLYKNTAKKENMRKNYSFSPFQIQSQMLKSLKFKVDIREKSRQSRSSYYSPKKEMIRNKKCLDKSKLNYFDSSQKKTTIFKYYDPKLENNLKTFKRPNVRDSKNSNIHNFFLAKAKLSLNKSNNNNVKISTATNTRNKEIISFSKGKGSLCESKEISKEKNIKKLNNTLKTNGKSSYFKKELSNTNNNTKIIYQRNLKKVEEIAKNIPNNQYKYEIDQKSTQYKTNKIKS